MSIPRVLILGGTGDARTIAERLTAHGGIDVTLSLAGRTAEPAMLACRVRSGGFGGVEGLAAWLRAEHINVIIDATHPFAQRISVNASMAALRVGTMLLALHRAEWQPVEGDRWILVGNAGQAAAALGDAPLRVFLAIGRQELAPFAAHPQHSYVVRSVDPVAADLALQTADYILGKGPFDVTAELQLLCEHGVQIVVAKNSGGAATYGKIEAARMLRLPVVLIERPKPQQADAATSINDVVVRCLHAVGLTADRGE